MGLADEFRKKQGLVATAPPPSTERKMTLADEFRAKYAAPESVDVQPSPITAGGFPQLSPQMPTQPEPAKPSIYEKDWGIWDHNRQFILSQLEKEGISLGDLGRSAWAQVQNIGNIARAPARFITAAVQEFQQAGEKERPEFAERSFTPTAPFRALKAGARAAVGIAPDAQTQLAIGRDIVSNMGLQIDEPQWVLENPGQHAVGELLSAWYGSYGTDPIFFAALMSRAKTVLAQRAVQAGKKAVTGAVAEDIPWEKLKPLAEAVGTRKGQKALNQILRLWAREKNMSYGEFRKAVAKIQGMPKDELQRVIAGMGKKGGAQVPVIPSAGVKPPPTGAVTPGVPAVKPSPEAPVSPIAEKTPGVKPTGKLFEVKPIVPAKRAPKPPPTAAEIARVEKEKAEGLFGPGRGKAAEQLKITPKPKEPTVEVKIGGKKMTIPEKRLPETKEIRAKIDKTVERHAELLAGQYLEAPKGQRYPVYTDEEVGPGDLIEWRGEKSMRHPFLREYTTKQVKKALAEKKGYVWQGIKEVARQELEEGGMTLEGPIPPDAEFTKLLAEAEAKIGPMAIKKAGPAPAQADKERALNVDKLNTEVRNLHAEMEQEFVNAKYDDREPDIGKMSDRLGEAEGKLFELKEEKLRMGGPPAAPPEGSRERFSNWLATHDEMTSGGLQKHPQILNKHYFDKRHRAAIKTAGGKENENVTLLMGDIDGFGKMQDVPGRGHPWGDKAIKDYFKIADKIARKHGGTVGRFGGDEMMVSLPGKNEKQTLAIAEQIRDAVERQGLAGADATTSIGLANFPSHSRDPHKIFTEADAALYMAKNTGRNRVISASELEVHRKAKAAGIQDAEQMPPEVKAKEITDQIDMFGKDKSLTAKTLDKLIDIRANAEDFIWAFGYQRVRYPGLRERALEAYHRRAASGGTAAHKALKIIGKQKLSEQERAYMSFVHEDKSLTTAQKAEIAKELGIKDTDKLDKTRGTIADAIKASAKAKVDMGIMERPWPESAIHRNAEEIERLQAKGILNRADRERLEVLKKDNEVLADFNWLTHKDIPNLVREAFKQKFSPKARARLKTRPGDLSYLYKKRKGRLTLYDLWKKDIIKLDDASMTKLFMEGIAETEQKMAMKQLYDYVKASGFTKHKMTTTDPSWLPVKASMVGFYSPEYSSDVMHPAAVRMYQTMVRMMKPELTLPERIMAPIYAAIKLATFATRPGLLLTYDAVFQKAMAGAWALDPKAESASWGKAVADVLLKSDDYVQNDVYGLYQRMDIGRKATIDEAIKMTERQIASEIPDWKNQLEKLAGMSFTKDEARKILMAGINPVTNVAWVGDEIARTQGTEMLIKMGFGRKEACDIIAHKYGPYSELGVGYKRLGRFMFYVMTFKVNMPLEFTKSVAIEPIKAVIQAIRAKRGRAEPLTAAQVERIAKGFIGPVIVASLIDWYLTDIRGFKRDKPSIFIPTQNWKYRKTVRIEVAPGKYETKELVIGVNNIYNIPTKVIMRAIAWDPLRDPDPRGWQAAKNMMRWEWHPANMVIWDCITNRRRFGTGKVYYPKETNHAIIARDCAKYAFASWFRLYGAMTTAVTGNDFATGISPAERKRQQKIFKEGLIWLDRLITENAGYKYVRTIPFESWAYIVNEIKEQHKKEDRRLTFAMQREMYPEMTLGEQEKVRKKYKALFATNENWKKIVTEHYKKMYPPERLKEGIQ